MVEPIILKKTLKAYFGYDSFRDGQEETITAALKGQDTLVLLPTGTGKSICYQLTGYLLEGTVVIVSPLLSLMQDQVEQLQLLKEKRVAALNSLLDYSEKEFIIRHLNEYKFLFLSPEMLQNERILAVLKQLKISLFTIDEAHCISQWGMDFRPDYLELGKIRAVLGNPLTMALTATANRQVKEDILACLKLDPLQTTQIVHSVDRKNIALVTITCDKDKKEQLLKQVKKLKKPGIIYFSSKKMADDMADFLRKSLAIRVASYHSDLETADRILLQQQFIYDEIDVICATNAFGMGINKKNIRFVIHYHMPASVEAYLQEIGRCGRDGKPSVAILLYEPGDGYIQVRLQENDLPTEAMLEYVYRKNIVLEGSCSVSQQRLLENYLASKIPLAQAKQQLRARVIRKEEQLRYMITYAETKECKRRVLLHYFEEKLNKTVENCCSNCGIDEEIYEIDEKNLENRAFSSVDSWEKILQEMFSLETFKRQD
ncbi:RecQ family ATP-dependent DNA helicase [Carnobacterium divergens]|uniref:RecQ family ATP-dependent DNA helicase n=1 Tax=Carnobacterium divergens TaxID=2748 RepID=UPI0028915814|nr:ATP-dependent DNA helicase RecQ [Carnobacterium divergens]MDT2010907.1 ATP-dependent DNA helicase [Carnobacterium divergens]